MKSRLFATLAALFSLLAPALSQTINVSIESVTGPSGSSSSPFVIIDADSRASFDVSAEVDFTLSGSGTASGSYRVVGELVPFLSSPLPLDNPLVSGGTRAGTGFRSVNLSSSGTSAVSETFDFEINPGTQLSPTGLYQVRFHVERYDGFSGTFPDWTVITTDVAGPFSTSFFRAVHFTNTTDDPERNIQAYLTSSPTWLRSYAVATDPAKDAFRINVPYRILRYDLGLFFTSNVTFEVEVDLTDDLGNPVPLADGGVTAFSVPLQPRLSFGVPDVPVNVTGSFTALVRPQVQLDSRNRSFTATVRLRHVETPPSGFMTDATRGISSSRLLHFNGNLLFGSGPSQVATTFTSIGNNPGLDADSPSGGAGGYVESQLRVDGQSGEIPQRPDLQFGNNSLLGVRLLTNGDALVTSGSEEVTPIAGGTVTSDFGDSTVKYSEVALNSTGAVAKFIDACLPQGLSYTPDGTNPVHLPEVRLASVLPLDSAMRHATPTAVSLPPGAAIFDEARPLIHAVSDLTFKPDGSFDFVVTSTEWAHTPSFDQLDADNKLGRHASPEMRERLTNEGYLRHVGVDFARTFTFTSGPDGSARCEFAELDIEPGRLVTHFPKNTELVWNGGSIAKIVEGIYQTGSLEQLESFSVGYDGSCPDDPCISGAATATSIAALSDKDAITLTADGGLWTAGELLVPQSLEWGLRGDGSGGIAAATHATDQFVLTEFAASGNQLYAADNTLFPAAGFDASSGADLAPPALLFSGHQPDEPEPVVRPFTDEYKAGSGAYPGLNFRVRTGGSFGQSILADSTTPYPYELVGQASKYYISPSGLSGRHPALEGSFAGGLEMYGYEFKIKSFQLTYLDNENERSWVNGAVRVPYPSDFSQSFKELRLSCTGQLEGADLDPEDLGDKPLAYWVGAFSPKAMTFNELPGGPACYPGRALSMGLTTQVAHVPTPLSGTLAFLASGNIATIADGVAGVDNRLGLPSKINIEGPADENYTFIPVGKLYFNNPDLDAPGTGFITFPGTIDVPYFTDLRAQLITSANSGAPANLYLASGWESGSHDPFTLAEFDPDHQGWPGASGPLDYESYRNPPTGGAYSDGSDSFATYRIRATQDLFGLIPLEYPLTWSFTGRYFKSAYARNDNLVVLRDVVHQVDYMSAENLEVSFGAKYEGLPEINLASTVYSAVDEQIGAGEALANLANGVINEALNDGVESMGDLVADTLEDILEPVFDEIETQVIRPAYGGLETSYNNAFDAGQTYDQWLDRDGGFLKSHFDQYFSPAVTSANSLKTILSQLGDANNDALDLLQQVDSALLGAIAAIDSVSNSVKVVQNLEGDLVPQPSDYIPEPGEVVTDSVNGILALVEVDGDYERQIVQALVRNLINELAGPDIAGPVVAALDSGSSELNDRLNAVLEDIDPTLDRINEALLEARGFLVEVRGAVADGQEVFQSFGEIIGQATTEINAIITGVQTFAYDFIDQIAAAAHLDVDAALSPVGNFLEEFSEDEFAAAVRAELRDRILESLFIQQIQYTLRQYIYDVDLAIRSAIDSAFSEVRNICEAMIQEALGPIDDAINGMVGQINEYAGSGEIDGYVHFQGDSVKRLRIDAKFEFKMPDEMQLHAYLEILAYESGDTFGPSACLLPGEKVVETKIGALDVPLDWISPDLRADLEVKFSLRNEVDPTTSDPGPVMYPRGIGGSVEMTGGELSFEAFKITKFAAATAISIGSGADKEAYLAATARMEFSSYEVEGGLFFGRTCSLDPLVLVDPDVAEVLGTPPFTGAYVYGEVWLPISETLLGIPASCLFRISAGVGCGAFYFVEGPTYGGKLLLGASGEALCIVSIKGEIVMVGVKSGGSMRFNGRGTLTGKAGACPFCLKFKESVKASYVDGSWSIDL